MVQLVETFLSSTQLRMKFQLWQEKAVLRSWDPFSEKGMSRHGENFLTHQSFTWVDRRPEKNLNPWKFDSIQLGSIFSFNAKT